VAYHEPVLLEEAVEGLDVRPGSILVDATYGGGGHARQILDKLGETGKLIAFDQDRDALRNRIRDPRLVLVHHNFRYLKRFLRYEAAIPADGVLADLGVSSHQFDEPGRGFTFRAEAELDMRMNPDAGVTAGSILATYPATQLQQVFSEYGEVHNAKTAAKRLVEARSRHALRTAADVRDALEGAMPKGAEAQYLAKLFQALRIEVNDELGALKAMLLQAAEVLRPGGRLVVISYHSLEDRLVKVFLRDGGFDGPPAADVFGNRGRPLFRQLTRKPVEASEKEIGRNPRARSAKMRIAEKQ
jgi:16S rRNA (cytosine1402-N4)-methyltransferase